MKYSKYILVFLALCCALTFPACTQKPSYIDPTVDMRVREINMDNTDELEMLDKARSAVVGISVDLSNGYAIGSGVAVKDGNYILTNNHVVEDGGNIQLYYADKSIGSGKVLWKDPGLDLAIVKSSREIPYLRAGATKALRVGEPVFALGTPLTLQFKHTVTKGVVSALNRTLEVESKNGSNFLQCLVQHDASINPGNSGGPLINSQGEVVGINTLKATEGEGIGFASPIEVASAILDRIIQDNSYVSPYLGLFGFDSEIAQVYGEAMNESGVYVVSTNGPALEAGIKKGDLITAIDDHVIKNMQDLRVALFAYNNNDEIQINLKRGEERLSISVELAKK